MTVEKTPAREPRRPAPTASERSRAAVSGRYVSREDLANAARRARLAASRRLQK